MFKNRSVLRLEQAGNLTGLDVDVNTAVSGVSSSTGHHGDGTGHGAQELGAAVLQDVADGQLPTGGNTLLGVTSMSISKYPIHWYGRR